MFRKVLAAAALLAVLSHAFAAVDVNTANEDALRGIKGVGPARAKAILDERSAHGPYKDASDLGKRVKGMGGHTVERLQSEGLAIGPAQPQAVQAKVAQTTPAKAGTPQAAVAVKKETCTCVLPRASCFTVAGRSFLQVSLR